MKTPHFAIIGAGTAGLATAILLAREGHHVVAVRVVAHDQPRLRDLRVPLHDLGHLRRVDEHAFHLGE